MFEKLTGLYYPFGWKFVSWSDYVAFLGFVRFWHKHNTQYFTLQVFHGFFRKNYRIYCSNNTMVVAK